MTEPDDIHTARLDPATDPALDPAADAALEAPLDPAVDDLAIPEAGARDLDAAVAQLRGRSEPLPPLTVERLLHRAWSTPRMAQLLRAAPPHDYLQVSTTALVAMLRERLDEGLQHAAVGRITCSSTRDGVLEGVTVELVVQYGEDARASGARAHELVEDVVHRTLGDVLPPHGVTTRRVHVGDVTIGDPHLVHPQDEV